MAASQPIATSWNDMAKYVNIIVGIFVGMVSIQLLLSLLGVPFDGGVLPWRMVLCMQR